VGYGYEPNYFAEQFEDPFKRYGYLRIMKFEVVCADGDVEKFLGVIESECHTGNHGDGMVFVSDVVGANPRRRAARVHSKRVKGSFVSGAYQLCNGAL